MNSPQTSLDWEQTEFAFHVSGAQSAALALDEHIRALTELRDNATAQIAKFLRASGVADLDLDAIAASAVRPYTLIPSGKHGEWYAVHYRGIKMPMIGWLEKREDAFDLFRVTRSMDLLTPFPQWIRDELDIRPPEHRAVIDGTRTNVRITDGDEGAFKKRYGAFLGKQNSDGTYKIKPGDAWIRLVAQLIKDGILPFQVQPIDDADWIADARCNIKLRAYQSELVDQFLATGATLLNIPPGAGKTFITTYLLAHLRGKHLVCVDTTTAREQWQQFLKENAPDADVVVTTYQSAHKFVNEQFTLFVPDEAHRLPAATFSKLAFIQAKYRIGPTGTAWREDDRQFMITALTGAPAHLSWAEMIRNGVLKKPRIIVETHKDDAAKTHRVQELVGKHRGRALIFCDWIEQGNALANALQVPFVHGETKNKLEQIRANEKVVVSRIADTSLDLPDLTLVIDFGFMKNARTQGAQRLGRLLHSEKGGAYHLLLTAREAADEPRRLWGIEQELLGEVDIEHFDFTGASGTPARTKSKSDVRAAPMFDTPRTRVPSSTRIKPRAGGTKASAAASKPKTEIDAILDNRAVQRALEAAYAEAGTKIRGEKILHRILALGWDAPVSTELLIIGGQISKGRAWVYNSAFQVAEKHQLMARVGDGYQTNRARLNQLVKASERFSK